MRKIHRRQPLLFWGNWVILCDSHITVVRLLLETFLLSLSSGIIADNWLNDPITQLAFKTTAFGMRLLTGIWFAFPLLNYKVASENVKSP